MQSLGGDPDKGFIIGGISAGANISAVLAHLYRDDKISPPLTGVYLSVPSTLSHEVVPERFESQFTSREQNANAPILGKGSLDLFASECPKAHLSMHRTLMSRSPLQSRPVLTITIANSVQDRPERSPTNLFSNLRHGPPPRRSDHFREDSPRGVWRPHESRSISRPSSRLLVVLPNDGVHQASAGGQCEWDGLAVA
jgi:acetyl esterase/lipase